MASLINGGLPFVGADAQGLGLSRHHLRQMQRENCVRRVLRGVYVDAREPDSRELRARALALVKPPHAVFFGATVGFLLGLDVFRPGDRFDLVPRCIVPHHAVRCTSTLVRCVEGYVPAEEVIDVDGLEVTTPVRTTVDLLRTMRRPHALAAADSFAHAGIVTPQQVQEYVGRLRRYPGVVQARELAALMEPLTESPGESWLRLRLVDAGFPRPRPQLPILDRRGDERARLDLAYEEARVGVEYDGILDHTEPTERWHDEKRRTYLRDIHGWRIVVAGRDETLGSDPGVERQVGEWLGQEPVLPRRW